MEKKTIGISLMIFLVMIISIGAISAADTNDTVLGQCSDTNSETTSVSLEEDNATSLSSETGSDVEINVNDNQDELSNQDVGDGSFNLNNDFLSAASNDDLLGENPNFYYNNKWYGDLDDAVDDACDNGGGTIYLTARAWGYDSAEREITISDGVSITFQPYNSGDTVIFDGQGNRYWFFKISDANAHITFNDITFRNGGDGSLANEGGAIRIIHGSVTFKNCVFENNKACENHLGGFGWGGAIFLDESDASLIAKNCRFINNKADNGGGAVCAEDGASASFEDCYFEGNTAPDGNNVLDKDGGSHTFNNCRFIGSGSLHIDVDVTTNTVQITPDVDDDVNYAVLYKNGVEYDRTDCNDGSTATFSHLEKGTYTVYMMKNWEAKYEYPGNTFSLINPSFVLDGVQVFENLSAAVNAIPSGGSGVITVGGGTYTERENFDVVINGNKNVTIKPKDDSLEQVIFSTNSFVYEYLLRVYEDCHLTMEDITITGLVYSALNFDSGSYGTISNCEFENIYYKDGTMHPIKMWHSNVVLNDCTFESNGNIWCSYSTLNIDDCTFTSNSYVNIEFGSQGGAIHADSSSNVTVTNSEFKYNEAINTAEVGNNAKGGAIYATKLKVDNTEFIGNGAGFGAAIYIAGDSNDPVNITNCVFDSNVATEGYRHIYSESATRIFNLEFNEYDVNIKIDAKDGSYGEDYILEGDFDWGCNLDNNYTFFTGTIDDGDVVGDLVNIEDSRFKINVGVLSGGTHEFAIIGMFAQEDSNDYFYTHRYHSDLYGNQFYIDKDAYAKILIDKAKITLTLDVKDVLIPETPVLNVEANRDLNYTIFIGTKYYQVEVKNGKGSMPLTGLDLGNYTVVGMRGADENHNLVMNFTTFTISKTYSNFLVLSTNVEYDTLAEAVANSNNDDMIYIKNGTYKDTKIVISNKTLDIVALDGAVFDAQGGDANFITVNENAMVHISGITFTGLHNRNTKYGAIVNHGYLELDSCNFTNNMITKTSFAENGGAAVFNDGYSLEINNCNFINNVAPLKVSTAAVTSLGYEDVSITSSKFINNSAREGGALHFKNISQFESAITSCEFDGNVAVKGSAIYLGNNSKYLGVTLSDFKNNNIKNNFGENAQLEGGVIYVNANNSEVIFNVELSHFENNSNRNVNGGVICLDGISKANIDSSTFKNNKGNMGSVIFIKNPSNKKLSLFIDNSIFINNNATNGAIATSPKVTTFIDECLFANNTGENRHIYSNGFTVVHDSILDVKNAKLNALSVQHGQSSTISGTADIGTNIYAVANLTVAGENVILDIKNNTFSYKTGILNHGKYYAVLNSIADSNNNTYLMDSITEIFRVNNIPIDLNVSVDNITYGETLKVVETLPQNATGTISYQLNGKYYTKEELESLMLDAGKYTLVAIYDHEDYAFSTFAVDFEVYKANPTISVADVEINYGDNITVNIETNVPSIYIIEIENYKYITLINGSKSTIEIEKILEPGSYTIKVTSQERVNYKSNYTEAILKVNKNLSLSRQARLSIDDAISNEENIYNSKFNANKGITRNSLDDNKLGDEYDEGKFIYQYDEDSDYEYFDTLEDAIDNVVLNGAGIITVRGGTYSGVGFCGIYLEGELELTIKAYEGEEVIFDCENANYFLYLTYETEIEWTETTPPVPYEEQTEGPTVTLDNITVINGYNSDGGAIEMDAGVLTLANCTFTNNNADNGGVIYIGATLAEVDATVIGLNTTFTNNYASDEGGVVYISGGLSQSVSASFYLCTFLDNYQGEDENRVRNYYAGADATDIESRYCIFNGNGTIYSFKIDKINQTVSVNGTSTDIFDSVVLMYFDQAPLYSIYNNGSRDFNVTFEDVIAGNYTLGIMNDHNFNTYLFDNKFEMKVPNFILSEDEVYENLTDAIDAVVENGIIYANANYYTEENMEIDIRKSFTLKNFRNREVTFDGCSEKWFFTIAEGYTVEFDGIYFTDGAIKNHATIENYGTFIIKNCTFDSFETSEIIYNSGLLNILNSEFSLNFVDNALVWNDENLVIDTVEFSNNIVNISSAVYNSGIAEIVSSNFTANSNGGNGGAIYTTNSLSIKDTVFNENEGRDGGAVYNTGILHVLNATFEDNSASGYGGVIFNGNEANIFNSTFTGGSSEKDGGAIYNNHTMTINNSTFVGNSATGNGGAIYNNRTLELTDSFFGVNYADEFANIYNAGNIQFSGNTFDFYDVVLIVPDGQYGIPTTITGTLDPQFNMDIQVTLPEFVNNKDATVTISEGVFEYVTDILPKGIYDVVLNEVIYDIYGNIYYGESIRDRLIVYKANVYINLTVDDVVLPGTPVLKISTNKDGVFYYLFNNKFTEVNITGGQATITLDAVGEGNYSVFVVREGDENYNDAINMTTFKVSEYEGKFIVNSTGHEFETLREAIADSSNDDIIYVREGNYTGADNLGLTIFDKKLSIISLGDVVFDGNSTYSNFLTVNKTAEVTLCDIVITGFYSSEKLSVIYNEGILTIDGCIFANNTFVGIWIRSIIYNCWGNLTVVGSAFHDNILNNGRIIYSHKDFDIIGSYKSNIIVSESTFEKNTITNAHLISMDKVNSVKIISNIFAENSLKSIWNIISVQYSRDVLISSEFYNNTQSEQLISLNYNNNTLVNNSIFTGNTMDYIIKSYGNNQSTISDCTFAENTVNNVVLSQKDKNLSVLKSEFSDNRLSGNGALNIASEMNAIVNGSIFTNNKADKYRNIYSVCDVNITNSVFDALNVDYNVSDIDYGQTETIKGTIDIGTNLKSTVILDINSNSYSINVTDGKFTYNSGILNGGDYNVVLNPKDNNSNTYLFNKITKIFTVNRIDPGLNVSIDDITQGENLKINLTIDKRTTAHVVYGLNGNMYTKNQLENLTLNHGNYLVTATYMGDKNFLPSTVLVNVEVHKVAPNITVSDVVVDYGEDININVSVDVADYYTVFLENESVSLYVDDNATFTFSNLDLKSGIYEIIVYVFETDDYAEAYAYANLTVNKIPEVFWLSNDIIVYGENATISVTVPVNAYGNISYTVYDIDVQLVYSITQSCLEELIVPNLDVGKYIVMGTYGGDSYYTNNSKVISSVIYVNSKGLDLKITVSNITLGENATVTVESNIDDDYLVYVGSQQFVVTVIGGTGNVSVSNLTVGSYVANVTTIDSNYSAFNQTVFEVAPISSSVVVSVEDIIYGEDAIIWVYGEIDDEYLVELCNQNYTVNVVGGKGNTTISGLFVGEDILVSVSIEDGNYSAFNTTTFNIAPKQISAIISVEDIVYGEDAVVIVKADVDGEYLVYVGNEQFTVTVVDGAGNVAVSNLTVGSYAANVTVVDGNYSAVNSTSFDVEVKQIDVLVSVDDITYGEDAVVIVKADVDGEYIVEVCNQSYAVYVVDGKGNTTIYDLFVGEDILASVSIADGNYSAYNTTTFNVAPKVIPVVISVGNIVYGEDAVVIVQSAVDGDYIVNIRDVNYTVSVNGGSGVVFISNLDVGNQILATVERDDNYTAFNETTFNIYNQMDYVSVSVDDITFGESAIFDVVAEIDGMYTLTVNNVDYPIEVIDGNASQIISGLAAGKYVAQIAIVDGNYSAFNQTVFYVVPRSVSLVVSVDDIVYGEKAMVIVKADVDGEYLVYVGNEQFTVTVVDGAGNVSVSDLSAGNYVANVTVVDGNYSAVNSTSFDVEVKQIDVTVSVEDITYGEDAVIIVKADVDGEYIVEVCNESYVVSVVGGKGNATIYDLFVGEDILASVSIADGNYSAYNTTTFNVTPKEISVFISVGNIVYGEDAVVIVQSDVDGDYIVNIRDVDYTVSVNGGTGVKFITSLTVGEDILASVSIADGNYSAYNTTTFNIAPKVIPVVISVEDIVYGEDAVIIVQSDVDGEYLVYVDDEQFTVTVVDGAGNVSVSDLTVGSYAANVTVVDGNYSAVNSTSFDVEVKQIDVSVSVDDIVYGEKAMVIVEADVDGEYIVEVCNESYVVSVVGGKGNATISDLFVGEDILASVSIADGNYSAYNTTTFNVTPKEISAIISVEDIIYGEDAVVIVKADVDGEYLVYVGNEQYMVTVIGGVGNVSVSDLSTGSYVANVTVVDGNYSAVNSTSFDVEVKQINVSVSVDDIVYGEKAMVIVEADVDGEYIVEVCNESYVVSVVGGKGNATISDLFVGEDILASVSIADGNYSAYNTTTFNVAPKVIPVIISVGNIVYGEDAVVIVQSDVVGDYIVNIRDVNYTVSVNGGTGVKFITSLTVGEDILASVSIADGNYSAYNTTTFNIAPKQISAIISVEDIVYGEDAVVIVKADVDGEYLVYVDDEQFTVTVVDGAGNVSVSDLSTGSYVANVTVVDGNYSAVNSTSFDVEVKQIDVSVSVDDIIYGDNALVVVLSEIDGEYLVYVDDDSYVVNVVDGRGDIAVDGLTVGTHVANVTVVDGNYSAVNSTSFDVAVRPYNITVIVEDIYYGENATVTVILPEDATGNVTIGNETVNVINGIASAVLTNLPVGNTTVPITYSGDKRYTPKETNATISVKDTSDVISAPDVTKYYHGPERFVVNVTDYLGNPIANKSVAIVINGQSYTRTTNAIGTTSIALSLVSGVYNATTTVDNTTINSVITILTTVNGTDLVKVFKNDTQYYATFLDSNGKYLAEGTIVKFNINGVMYERNVFGDKGLAKLNINLPQGEYIITAMNLVTGEMASNKITVIPRIVENNDLTKYYRNDSQYTVKLIGDDGNPVGAGENVTFNINGVFYNRTTDENGVAQLNINLPPGDYIITAEYKECKVSNNIKVLPVLSANDLTKKQGGPEQFVATLLDGQGNPYGGQTITFNINGVFYNRTTESNGEAKLNIKLPAGEYIITSSFNGTNIANKVTITA